MKIIKLTVENIKRVKAVQITPQGNAVIISGKNGQGKSSTLDAIEMALSGKDAIPTRPVREGEQTARIVLETDKYIVTRHWTSPENTHLKLELKGEGILGSPQKALDQIVGDLSFDPLEFSSLEPKAQLKMLKDICKLDFTALDNEFRDCYEKRKDANKTGEIYRANFDALGSVELNTPELDIVGIREERAKVEKLNRDIEASERTAVSLKSEVARVRDELSDIAEKITNLQAKFDRKKEELEAIEEQIPTVEEAAARPKQDLSRFDVALQEWANYEANQKLIAQKKAADEKLQGARAEWAKHDKRLKEIEDTKKKMVSSAPMPIQGLSLGESEVLYNGIPFAQLSTSEQIRVSMAIAMALNPKLRVVIIKNASLLDKKAMDELTSIAEEKDFQVWLEKVAEGPEENCIYIENGVEASGGESTEAAE